MKTQTKRTLSAEGRANIAAAQKERWAKAKRAGTNHAPVDEPVVNMLRRDDPPREEIGKAGPRPGAVELIRSAVASMEDERDTLTVRIDTLKDVLAQM